MRELTKKEAYILGLLTEDYFTVEKVVLTTKKSKQSVYKIIRKLKEKGLLKGDSHKGFTKPSIGLNIPSLNLDKSKLTAHGEPPLNSKKIRLHGQAWRIKLLKITKSPYEYSEYVKIKSGGNKVIYDGNTITLHRDSIRVYCSENRSFWGSSVEEATSESIKYWNLFFVKLENRFKITILKEQIANFKLFRQHYAEVENELAKEYNDKKIKLKVFAPEDGKLAYIIDFSNSEDEFEALHTETAPEDMNKAQKVFQQYRSGDVLLPDEVTRTMGELAKTLKASLDQNVGLVQCQQLTNSQIALMIEGINTLVKLQTGKIESPFKENNEELNDRLDYVG